MKSVFKAIRILASGQHTPSASNSFMVHPASLQFRRQSSSSLVWTRHGRTKPSSWHYQRNTWPPSCFKGCLLL